MSALRAWRLARMNLAIRNIEGNLGQEPADSFHRDLHKDLKADYILANPPFNMSDWGGDRLREDSRWKFGLPPGGNANFAWVQHFIHHLAPAGIAGFDQRARLGFRRRRQRHRRRSARCGEFGAAVVLPDASIAGCEPAAVSQRLSCRDQGCAGRQRQPERAIQQFPAGNDG